MSDEAIFCLHSDPDAARAAAQALFDQTLPELRRILPPSADIRHVGATAIPGCLTKGDLDIVVRVPADDFATAEAALAQHFARNTGSVHSENFAAFEASQLRPHLGIQLTAMGGPQDFFHTFMERLAAHPALLARYNDIKRTFDGQSMAHYRAAKGAFIRKVLSPRECS
jgi:GrpB-like predicted nucleotidyltransferase (UPF0157 family)